MVSCSAIKRERLKELFAADSFCGVSRSREWRGYVAINSTGSYEKAECKNENENK